MREIHLGGEELRARLTAARPPSSDDASITRDGRRLGSKEEVLEFLAESTPPVPLLPGSGVATGRPEPPPNIPPILAVLNRHAVEYLLVGGVATIVHGAALRTGDIDCLVDGSAENLHRLALALRELDALLRVGRHDEAPLLPVVLDEVMLQRTEISIWRTGAGNVDVLTVLPGPGGRCLHYDDLAEGAYLAVIEGMTARVASLDDVITTKQWANRPKDRQVLPELRELYQSQDAVDQEKEQSAPDHNSPAAPNQENLRVRP